ncbi:hypothetical protein GCK72_013050 [Caenorhabditis remanei]|uniref:Uncharacterized protein n=1 Tax=Caenorhabditis remanei TaxID=31234 RepID=A0A6A5GMQ5_CAERE|nr:hypothetical protein GCK72_013050 [Caenorhabditis remanei]KAF1756597.1 hypothetical protein GCK72_013050 [Caenorhabditis remanei]
MMKFIHFAFLLSISLHVLARATESSESESVDSSRSSSSEELKYNENVEDLVKIDGSNSTVEEVKDTDTAKNENSNKSAEADTLEKVHEPAGKTNLEKFDEGLESDKKEYVQKRAENAPIPSNSTDNLTEEDMKMMDQFNKTMEADEEMQRSNETVLGIDTFGAQGI